MGQATATLSGGENIRIKIMKASKSIAKVIGVDEPFKGLSNIEIDAVANYLNRIREKEREIIWKEFFFVEDKFWWMRKYNRSTFYRLRAKSITDFSSLIK